jgi:hypothetical protein
MRISWVSADASKEQKVRWGTQSGNYPNEAKAISYTYTRDVLDAIIGLTI